MVQRQTDFCTCSSCAQVLERAYRIAQEVLNEKRCATHLVGVGHALAIIGGSLIRGELHGVEADEENPTPADIVDSFAASFIDNHMDLIDNHIEANDSFDKRCVAIYEASGMGEGIKQ